MRDQESSLHQCFPTFRALLQFQFSFFAFFFGSVQEKTNKSSLVTINQSVCVNEGKGKEKTMMNLFTKAIAASGMSLSLTTGKKKAGAVSTTDYYYN
jgi:hypothetical protein